MQDWLAVSAHAYPKRIALIYRKQTWTFVELHGEVNALTHWLKTQFSVSEGDFVAVLMGNQPDYVFVIHALMRLGAVIVPLNTRLTSDEIAYQLDVSAVKHLIVDDAHQEIYTRTGVNLISISDFIRAGNVNDYTKLFRLDETHSIIFTSGTTGKPKGVELTYSNYFYAATASALRIGTTAEDRWLCVLPLYHVGGLSIVMRSALYGTCIVLHDRFDVETVSGSISRDDVTLISLVPTMLFRLLDFWNGSPPAHKLRLILLGGAAATQELVHQTQALNIPIATTYGLSEACSQVATNTPENTAQKPASVGKAMPFSQIHLLDEQGKAVKQGQIGEIVISGPTVMRGYLNNREATDKTIRDNQLFTGDLGYFGEDGDLFIVQRRSDLIVTGGENVYPSEVENTLRQHPQIKDACVVGIPNAEWGQIVSAMILPHANAQPDIDEIQQFLRQHLAGYKIPRKIRFVTALPQTASGKIERRTVQQQMQNDTT